MTDAEVAVLVISAVALVISAVALLISHSARCAAARSADAAEATYRESISCRVIAEVLKERGGKNRPALTASGKAAVHDIEYTLTAEYVRGEEREVSGGRTSLAPPGDTTIEEIDPGNCVGIRGIITWKDSSGAPWSACRSKGGKWVVVQREHSVESLPN